MLPGIFRMVSRSVKFYRKPVLYQIAIIALLCAVITGSMLTGRSVKSSLKRSATEHLGNAGIIVSSGVRYFDNSLPTRFAKIVGINTTGILSITGYCQNLTTQKHAYNTSIIGINSDFFSFHGNDSLQIKQGEAAINQKLADYLGITTGEEITIHFNKISEIPLDAPFAPSKEPTESIVLKVGKILNVSDEGNFSLSISQIAPMNIFINLSDLYPDSVKSPGINRLLIKNTSGITTERVRIELKRILKLTDIGLSLRYIEKTGEYELISDRIFIDKALIIEIKNAVPAGSPVITYLANSIKRNVRATPYSFVAALPSTNYPGIGNGNDILINKWLAEDLQAKEGDTLQMYWYSPDSLNKLIQRGDSFIIKRIVDMNGIWSDSLLMPDFPGISAKESCSEWDAGDLVNLKNIRHKDENYWRIYRGTPKAFISYEKGKELWGNNFGPATAVRFKAGTSESEVEKKLTGSLDPSLTGFSIDDLFTESLLAADKSVDFSTLLLGLGFFLLLASFVLLSFATSSYFDTKKDQISLYFALGFNNKWIANLLLLESGMIAFLGCIAGSFAGLEVNILLTRALNTVWKGAVQTDTITAYFNLLPVMTGSTVTFLAIMVFMLLKIWSRMKKLNLKEKEVINVHSAVVNLILLFSVSFVTITLFVSSFLFKDQRIALSFISGIMLLVFLLLLFRQYLVGSHHFFMDKTTKGKSISLLYYSSFPSQAITPILFIASGIFAVFITGANKMDAGLNQMKRSGGTGGYSLWCETSVALREDLNSISGKKSAGLDIDQLKGVSFVQARRSAGNDASCLNLNHITAPQLLGINPDDLISKEAFSFAKVLPGEHFNSPWKYLKEKSSGNIIYGIADQSVLEWGLKIRVGDTLVVRTENGQPLKIIIAAGLKSSVFQGFVLIGIENFSSFNPSISGSTVMLVEGDPKSSDLYRDILAERFDNYGINIEKTTDRLASFYEVTNTYLSVFGVFGALGMITGIAGLGFVLLRNYNSRKREFALMMATGFSVMKIRNIIHSEELIILFSGVFAGVIPALIATLPSLTDSSGIPWLYLGLMIAAIIATGLIVLTISIRAVTEDSLILSLRKE